MESQGVLLKLGHGSDRPHTPLSPQVGHLVLPEDLGRDGVGGNNESRVTVIEFPELRSC